MEANVQGALVPKLRGGKYRSLASDQRVQVTQTGLYTSPDVTVVCGEIQFDDARPRSLRSPPSGFSAETERAAPGFSLYRKNLKSSSVRRICCRNLIAVSPSTTR